jgi:hypothetical protein
VAGVAQGTQVGGVEAGAGVVGDRHHVVDVDGWGPTALALAVRGQEG